MRDLMQPDKLRDRVRTWALEQMRIGSFPLGSDAMLEALVSRGQLDRAEVTTMIETTGGSAQQLIAALMRSDIIQSETSRSPLRLAFPVRLIDQLLPGLFLTKVT